MEPEDLDEMRQDEWFRSKVGLDHEQYRIMRQKELLKNRFLSDTETEEEERLRLRKELRQAQES